MSFGKKTLLFTLFFQYFSMFFLFPQQNSFLWSTHVPVGEQVVDVQIGFYRGDLARLGLIIGDYCMTYWFYKKLQESRVNHITKQVEDDISELLQVINDDKSGKGLASYAEKKHVFLGLNPVKLSLLLPELLFFGWEEASRGLQKQASFEDIVFEEEAGGPPRLSLSVLSPLSLFKSARLQVVDSFKEYSLPLRVLLFLGTVLFFDSVYHEIWLDYLVSRRAECAALLQNYIKAMKHGSLLDLKRARERIRRFISRGHRMSLLLSGRVVKAWVSSRLKVGAWVRNLTLAAATAAAVVNFVPRILEWIEWGEAILNQN